MFKFLEKPVIMKISVCIPTYNQAKYLSGTIQSVLSQTLQPDEIIVSNDCSTDYTKKYLEKLSSRTPLLKIVNQPVNLGMNRNTDVCLRLAKGDFIVKLDSDDKLLPTYLKELNELLIKYPDAGFAHAAVQEIDENDNPTKIRFLARKEEYLNAESSLKMSLTGYRVSANIIMFRRKALEEVGYISSTINFAEDYFLSVVLSNAGYGNVYSQKVLACYRVWSDAGKVRQKRKLAEISGLIQVFNEGIEPAFKARAWNMKAVKKMRKVLAIRHTDSLGWNFFTREEKKALQQEICKLSSERTVKFVIWCYSVGLGPLFNLYNLMWLNTKLRIKSMIYR